MFEKRINIFTGHFGSGKTEVAINSAFKIKEKGFETAIIDMDIVNPFFRTKDAQHALEQGGIKLVAPVYANTNVDVPALPAEIYSFFGNEETHVVMDIGGDDLGAKVVSRYKNEIQKESYTMFIVINIRRPETSSKKKIIEIIKEIENSSSIKATGLINNTNVLGLTTEEDVLKGEKLIEEVAEEVDIPLKYTAIMSKLVKEKNAFKHELILLNKYIKLPWD